jgi:hypothetical protein
MERLTAIGAWYAAFVSGGVSSSKRWRIAANSTSTAGLRRCRPIGAPEQAQLFDDGSEHITVPVRLKGIRIERTRRFGELS